MNAQLPLFKTEEHNSERASTLDSGLTPINALHSSERVSINCLDYAKPLPKLQTPREQPLKSQTVSLF